MVLKMGHLHFRITLQFCVFKAWYFFSGIVYKYCVKTLHFKKKKGGGVLLEYNIKSFA